MQRVDRIDDAVSLPELTLRGIILGALITVVFTASNIYLGLKVGLTFSSAIPAAVISMAVLRLFPGANILENNMVQTQASAAGTLSSIIFILPGLVMLGHWQGFPFWQTLAICAAGGMLGVIFSIPLRHAMVVHSDLPYPEGWPPPRSCEWGARARIRAMENRRPGLVTSLQVALLRACSALPQVVSGFWPKGPMPGWPSAHLWCASRWVSRSRWWAPAIWSVSSAGWPCCWACS
jgi:putative OPT family oligopeptide transporter